MIIGAIVIVLLLCAFNRDIDRQADKQRDSDTKLGATLPVLEKTDGCLSAIAWLFLVVLLVALVGAAMVGGMGG